MTDVKHWAFFFGLGTLYTHELDAVANHEWRVLPLIRLLPEELGMPVFIAAHVPLFAVITALVVNPVPGVRLRSRLAVSVFLVIHGLLHALFMGHPAYEFSSTLSNSLIFGGSLLGLVHLILEASGNGRVARE